MGKQVARVNELSGTCAPLRTLESLWAFQRSLFNMKQWKLTYLVGLLEFDQECLLDAAVGSNKQVRWLKYGKDRHKNDENVDTLRGFYVCHEIKVLTRISHFRPSDLSLYFVKVLSFDWLLFVFCGSGFSSSSSSLGFGSVLGLSLRSITVKPNVNLVVSSNEMRF